MTRNDEVARGPLVYASYEDEVRGVRLAAWLTGLRRLAPQQLGALELEPLRVGRVPSGKDLLFREALESGVLEIRERGGVEGVEAVNRGGVPVLILDGEALSERKPRRVVAKSVLVPPRAAVALPVGLMERRRWEHRGSGPREGWPRPAPRFPSPALAPLRGQVGVVATSRGRLLGVELAAHPDTWASLAPRALAGYELAAEDAGRGNRPAGEPPGAGEWIERLAAARVVSSGTVGIGLDLSLLGEGIEGSALWHEGCALHLVAFPS